MVGIVDGDTKKVPLSEVAGKLKYVDPKCQMIKDAKTIGISLVSKLQFVGSVACMSQKEE